jgi:trans-AT polyketide synthase/acyltransferase/oxidoreductase domain-containing protein
LSEPTNGRGHAADAGLPELLARLAEPVVAFRTPDGGVGFAAGDDAAPRAAPMLAWVPPLRPEQLGDPAFLRAHGARFPYVAGAMANGVSGEALVIAMANAGFLAFFGNGAVAPARIEQAIQRIQAACPGRANWGFNLLPTPYNPQEEIVNVELFLRYGVPTLSASAWMEAALPVVWYRAHGIHRLPSGEIVTPNRVVAKLSRPDMARMFMEPAPEEILRTLVGQGRLTAAQAELARRVPLADDIDAEADSAGHTDRRPALPLLGALLAVRDEAMAAHDYQRPVRVGLAGGIASPASVAAAFTAGAAYVLTGSINQACLEADTSTIAKEMLAEADLGSVTMAPSGNFFEIGASVQVLKHRNLYAPRAAKLYELYRTHRSIDELSAADRQLLEKRIFRETLDACWQMVADYWTERNPEILVKAEQDPHFKMALLFRAYLGLSSRWAKEGLAERAVDYQIWCGPAMGAFNQWAKGSFLERLEDRSVVTVAENLIHGACATLRGGQLAQQLARHGVSLRPSALAVRPRRDWRALADGPRPATVAATPGAAHA